MMVAQYISKSTKVTVAACTGSIYVQVVVRRFNIATTNK